MMVRGIDADSKQKSKKINVLEDMLANKRAVENYCNSVGFQTEQKEKKQRKKKK